ncbi:hypothetical protein SAMN06313486_10913 [Epsilonproteobacteria bacterium SCGC AD-308-P11]|mgnify:CR=1 FL=1|nr:hypothetical protein SAMN06313486_10913 [Epsilonproteobacteria bacterium SCGC AD-308-P11]
MMEFLVKDNGVTNKGLLTSSRREISSLAATYFSRQSLTPQINTIKLDKLNIIKV